LPRLVALKSITYATRRLQAGDAFDAVARDARILKAIGKARDDYDVPVAPLPPPAVPTPPADDGLDALRAEAEAAGVRVDKRWGEARLRAEIASTARQKPPEPQTIEPRHVPAMTLGDSVRGSAAVAGSASVSGAVNVGSTAHPVYRQPDDC
jgi:hypothetical protein